MSDAAFLSHVALFSGPQEHQIARTAPIPPQNPPAIHLPHVQRFTLSCGLTALIVEKRGLPIVDVQMLFRTGGVVDPSTRAGLTSLAVDMFDEGARDRDGRVRTAIDIAEAAEDLGASLTASAGWDDIGFGIHTHTSRVAPAIELLADVVLRPTFTNEDFARRQKQRLAALLQERDEPRAVAGRAFSAVVFGASHPYGRSLHGTQASVAAITRDDIVAFHNSYIRPGNAFVVAVGEVDSSMMVGMLDAAFARWTDATVPSPRFDDANALTDTTISVVDRPGSAQSELRIGMVGPARNTPDYFPLLVMNTMLGGSFTSRLNLNLRQDKGYTYGASSSFGFRLWPGPFVVNTAVDTQVTADAIRQVMNEIRRIRDEPVNAQELARTHSYIALGLPRGFETTSDIAGHIAEIELYGLGSSYYDHFVERVRAVTAADVHRVANSYLNPAAMAVVLVGDFDATAESLAALGIGPVHKRADEDR